MSAPDSNLEAERALLGGIMLDAKRWPSVVESLPPEAFYDSHTPATDPKTGRHRKPPTRLPLFTSPANQIIWEVTRDLCERGDGCDITTVSSDLARLGLYDRVGGALYITSLEEEIVSTLFLSDYARIVASKWHIRDKRRQLAELSNSLADAADPLEAIRSKLDDIAASCAPPTSAATLGDVLSARLESIEQGHARGLAITSMPTINRATGGVCPSQLWVFAARPGVGKSIILLQVALELAAQGIGRRGLYVSLEMSDSEIADRVIAATTRTPMGRLRHGDADGIAAAQFAASDLASSKLRFQTLDSVESVAATVRAMHRQAPVEFVVVDYLQLLESTRGAANRAETVGTITRGLKVLARSTGIPVLTASQLNREGDRAARLPRLSDLRESGSIEQDADVVVLLHDPRKPDDPPLAESPIAFSVAKARQGGATGWFCAVRHGATARMWEVTGGPGNTALPFKPGA